MMTHSSVSSKKWSLRHWGGAAGPNPWYTTIRCIARQFHRRSSTIHQGDGIDEPRRWQEFVVAFVCRFMSRGHWYRGRVESRLSGDKYFSSFHGQRSSCIWSFELLTKGNLLRTTRQWEQNLWVTQMLSLRHPTGKDFCAARVGKDKFQRLSGIARLNEQSRNKPKRWLPRSTRRGNAEYYSMGQMRGIVLTTVPGNGYVSRSAVRHLQGKFCLHYLFYKKLKNVSCEYNRLNG